MNLPKTQPTFSPPPHARHTEAHLLVGAQQRAKVGDQLQRRELVRVGHLERLQQRRQAVVAEPGGRRCRAWGAGARRVPRVRLCDLRMCRGALGIALLIINNQADTLQ